MILYRLQFIQRINNHAWTSDDFVKNAHFARTLAFLVPRFISFHISPLILTGRKQKGGKKQIFKNMLDQQRENNFLILAAEFHLNYFVKLSNNFLVVDLYSDFQQLYFVLKSDCLFSWPPHQNIPVS